MDVEKKLLSSIIETKDFKEVVKKKVSANYFNGRNKEVFNFINRHYKAHHTTPNAETVMEEFVGYELTATEEPLSFYIDKIRTKYRYNIMAKTIQDIGEQFEEEGIGFVGEAEKKFAEMLSRISVESKLTQSVDSNKNGEEKISRYMAAKETKGITGIRLGIDALDEDMGGAKPGHFITIVAKQKTGKTFFETVIASYSNKCGFGKTGGKVLFLTQEMEIDEIDERADAVRFGLPYGRLLRGELGDFAEKHYFDRIKALSENPDLPPFIIARSESFTWMEIKSLIEEHTPDIVIVDGVYMIDPGGSSKKAGWENMQEITKQGKNLAQQMQVPIVVSTQFGKEATKNKKDVVENLELENIAFAYNSFGAYSDWVIALYTTEELQFAKRLGVKVLAARRRLTNQAHHILLNWDLDEGISKIGTVVEDLGMDTIDDEDEDIVMY